MKTMTLCLLLLLSACGGGGGDEEVEQPAAGCSCDADPRTWDKDCYLRCRL